MLGHKLSIFLIRLRQILFGSALAFLFVDFRATVSPDLITLQGWTIASMLLCALCFSLSILRPGLKNILFLIPALAAAACYIRFGDSLPEFSEMDYILPGLIMAGGCIGFYRVGSKRLPVQQEPHHTTVNINIITQLYDNTAKNNNSPKRNKK